MIEHERADHMLALQPVRAAAVLLSAAVGFAPLGCEKKHELQDFPSTVGGLSFGTPRESVGAVCEKLRSTPYDVGNDSSFACMPCPDPPVANIPDTLAKFCPSPTGPVLCELDFMPYEIPNPEPAIAKQRYDESLQVLRERYGGPTRTRPPHLTCADAPDPMAGNQDVWGWGKTLLPGEPMTSSRGVILLSYGCTGPTKRLVVTLVYRDHVGVQRNLNEYVQTQRGGSQ